MRNLPRNVLLFAIVLYVVAFGLRYWKLTKIAPFVDDQARDAYTVMEHLDQKRPFVLGPKASVGNFYVQPFYYYFISIPIIVFRGNPDAASAGVILIESLTPVLLYFFLRKYWNTTAAQVASVLYAVSPLVITFSSFAWSPNLIPIASVIAVISTFIYIIEKKDTWIMPAIVASMLAFHMHFQGAVLFVYLFFVFIMALLQRRKILPWILGGSIAVGVTVLPMLFDLRLAFENIQNIIKFFTTEHAKIYQTVRTFPFFWNYIPQVYEHALGLSSDGFKYGRIIFLLSFGFISVRGLIEFFKFKKIGPHFLLAVFITTAFVGLRLYKGDKLEYYLLFMLFVPAVSVGIGIGSLAKRAQIVVITVLCILLFSAGRITPATTQRTQRDYEVFTNIVGMIDRQFGPTYYLADVPYTFFKNSFYYVWKFQYGKMPWIKQYENEQKHLYVCDPEQHCGDLFCSVHDNEQYINETIAAKEHGNDYSLTYQFSQEMQGRRIQVVVYEKQ